MQKSKPRIIELNGDYRAESIVRRAGLEIVIPRNLMKKTDSNLKKSVLNCLSDLSRENALKLERMGCQITVLNA